MKSLNKTTASPLAPYTSVQACERARSLARIKVSAFGAGDRGFKSHRARHALFFRFEFDVFALSMISVETFYSLTVEQAILWLSQ